MESKWPVWVPVEQMEATKKLQSECRLCREGVPRRVIIKNGRDSYITIPQKVLDKIEEFSAKI